MSNNRIIRALRNLAVTGVVFGMAAAAFYVFWLQPRHVTPVLMYHRFGYEKSSLYVTPENFRNQMGYLKERGYRVIPAAEYVRGLKQDRKFDRKTVVITVDDGNADNFTYAHPVLKAHHFPATIFLIADYIGQDPEFLTWEQVKVMIADGISFGAHTRNDAYLPDIKTDEALRDQIEGSKRVIEGRLGETVPIFCYTTGGFTDRAKEIVRESGFEAAFTTNRGFSEGHEDLYELKRVKVTNSDTQKPFHFWAKLSGYYNLFRSKKRGY